MSTSGKQPFSDPKTNRKYYTWTSPTAPHSKDSILVAGLRLEEDPHIIDICRVNCKYTNITQIWSLI
jgi:hypothetical protein